MRRIRVGPKVMPAKFPGTCKACGCRFDVNEMISWTPEGARHERLDQCEAAKRLRAVERERQEQTAPKIDLLPIAEFLKAAQVRGLKRPKLRVLHTDGRSELRLSITHTGANPGSVAVVVQDLFVGCVRPSGSTTGELSTKTDLQEHLLRVARNPVQAAQEYAALMGLCSFCGKPLTDAGSVEVGYGPVCARHWGLPHSPKGTPQLNQVP